MKPIVLLGRIEPLSATGHEPFLGMPRARVALASTQPTITERPAIDLIRMLNEKIAAGEIKLRPSFRTHFQDKST